MEVQVEDFYFLFQPCSSQETLYRTEVFCLFVCLFLFLMDHLERTNSYDSHKTKAGFHNCLTRHFQASLRNAQL